MRSYKREGGSPLGLDNKVNSASPKRVASQEPVPTGALNLLSRDPKTRAIKLGLAQPPVGGIPFCLC
jgi:hypothetical protein